jgi:hypothetical protein
MLGAHEAAQCRSGGAGYPSIPGRIGARKATRMYGVVANTTALIASMRRGLQNSLSEPLRQRPEQFL